MRKVLIIGIGAGNPDYVTVQAVNAMNKVDVFFIPNKGAEKEDLRRLRYEICERFIQDREFRFVDVAAQTRDAKFVDYRSNVEQWHQRIAEQYSGLLMDELGDGECGAFLVWGDPTLYDSTLRIIEAIRSKGDFALEYEIIPGISSVQALAAQHKIPLNRIGESIHITTGRRIAEGFSDNSDSVIVMLDGEQAFTRLAHHDLDIHWGAYLGTEDEILVSGRLSEVVDEIDRVRQAARDRKGWIMDTYLLRKHQND